MGNATISSVTQGESTGAGELKSLDSTGQYNVMQFPQNLGNSPDLPHWVMFYINVPVSSKYSGGTVDNVQTASQQNFSTLGRSGSAITGGQTGATAAATGALAGVQSGPAAGLAAAAGAGVVGAVGNQISLAPKLKRITDSIAIYMPDTMLMDYSHSYTEESLTEALGKYGQAAAIVSGLVGDVGSLAKNIVTGNGPGNFISGPTGAEAASAIATATGAVNPTFKDFALKSSGSSINPQVELMFKGTRNREFVFQFRFIPKTSQEAQSIKDIIKTFRKYAAPEFNNTQNGRYFINPGQFDIQFYFNGDENDNLAKISTCVLENIAVNYSPGQFATFSDGMPAEINLQLRFKEADIIYRELIEEYGY